MGEEFLVHLRSLFEKYGYWTVALGLLLENAGLPVPGETILLFASFLAYSQHKLRLPYIILFGICAATLGDNTGYAIGRYGGRPLLDRYRRLFRLSAKKIQQGEALFARYGNLTIFFARFVTGLRVIAGPLAGVLRMPWRSFLLFNFLGAVAWVTTIASVGFLFGSQFPALLRIMGRINLWVLVGVAALIVLWAWWRKRRAGAYSSGQRTRQADKKV